MSCPCQIPACGWIRNRYLFPGKVKLHRAQPLSLKVKVLNFKVTAALDVSLLLIFSKKHGLSTECHRIWECCFLWWLIGALAHCGFMPTISMKTFMQGSPKGPDQEGQRC